MQLTEACEQFLSHCEYEKKLSPHSLRAYRNDLGHFTDSVGGNASSENLTATEIEAAAQLWLIDPELKAATVKRRIACIKSMVRWLFRKRLIKANPLENLDLEIKLPKRLPRNLQTAEIKTLLAIKPDGLANETRKEERPALLRRRWDILTARLAIEVMTLTGVRVGELVRVRQSQIDFVLQQIRILGKGNRERLVSFPDPVTTARLERYQKQALYLFGPQPHCTLFVNGLGRPANEQYIRRIVRLYAQAAQLERRITPHMLRHTAATQLLEAGVDIRFVQRILGHGSITTTEIYTHVSDHVLRAEISRANIRKRLEMQR